MKISCPTCAAKYTIADDKARGKSVKIKCKKCGTSIVAGGDEGASATWSINIAEDDQRLTLFDPGDDRSNVRPDLAHPKRLDHPTSGHADSSS